MLTPAYEIVPGDVTALQLEAPMRLVALGLQLSAVLGREIHGGAVINRRTPAGLLAFALQLEFLRRRIGWVEPPRRLKFLQRLLIASEAVRLAHLLRIVDAEPGKVPADAFGEFLGRALAVGVVEAKDELPAHLAREKEIEQRRADVAGVNAAGRARRESNGDSHDPTSFRSKSESSATTLVPGAPGSRLSLG